MKDITAKTQDVLEKLRENREKHVNEHKRALEGWRKTVANEVVELASYASSDKDLSPSKLNVPSAHDKPESHVEDYDNAIAMLEWHEEETITLSSSDVRNYIQDQWTWQRDFKMSSAKYSR